MHNYKLTNNIYGYLVDGNLFIEFLLKEYSAYWFCLYSHFEVFMNYLFIFFIENIYFTIINNYTIFYYIDYYFYYTHFIT